MQNYLQEVSFASEVLLARAVPAAGLTLGLALAAWGVRAVTLSGAIAGSIITFIICMAAGPGALFSVGTVFLLTFIATRIGDSRKRALGVAEPHEGRGASQIAANLAAAAMCSVPLLFVDRAPHALFIGASAALAEAAADTVSSEIGQAYAGQPRLITTFSEVPPGTNGGITALGTVAGAIAAALIASVCVWIELISQHWFLLVAVSGTVGMLFDSVLGATLERPGRLGNDSVNFTSTCFAAALALGIWFVSRAVL